MMTDLLIAHEAPHGLVYLAMFNARERAEIACSHTLLAAIRTTSPAKWRTIVQDYRAQRAADMRIPAAHTWLDSDAMQRQARADLHSEVNRYAALKDGRRNELFRAVCRIAKYAAHGVLKTAEVEESFAAAAEANGALTRYGSTWLSGTVKRGLERGANDALPPLARRFMEAGT